MSRWNAYLNSSIRIIGEYDGVIPLSSWLRDFFRLNKQMGSKDRKVIAETVYSFYRLGHAFKEMAVAERLLTAIFLCNRTFNDLLHFFKPEWNAVINLSVTEKLEKLPAGSTIEDIFPWQQSLSSGLNAASFNHSFLQQPDLFLRVRPGCENSVIQKLTAAGVSFKTIPEHGISLPNSTKASAIVELDKEAVVQDYNSQMTGNFFFSNAPQSGAARLWDCCAASGGKSMMAHDLNPGISITVSDVRESILHNLHQRFARAGIKNYQSFVQDLTGSKVLIKKAPFDIILADLPCTGSGTWSRTPEQLYFFDPEKIDHYSNLQKKILTNVVPQLATGGRLIYITCSVFRKENEAVAEYIQEQFHLELKQLRVLPGYEMKADSMFVAVFVKP